MPSGVLCNWHVSSVVATDVGKEEHRGACIDYSCVAVVKRVIVYLFVAAGVFGPSDLKTAWYS
ncbi:MAG: hypothetical protein NZ932_03210 [Candidatus Bathyarchaeota archaeon]|nr:hypothetical protein [Candidatus Bathyarchaeota archaeon]